MKRVRTALIWIFSTAVAFIIVMQGWDKFSGDGRWARSFAGWGYPDWFRIVVGIVETSGGISLLIPPFAVYGAIAVAAVMAGAVGTLLLDGRTVDAATPAFYCLLLL